MPRKTNKQLLDEKKARMLTVGELTKILSQYPEDTYIGKSGHFGEFLPMEKDCCILRKDVYITPCGWRHATREYYDIVDIEVPELGPDPD